MVYSKDFIIFIRAEIQGYCQLSPELFEGSSWPSNISYQIFEMIVSTCDNGYEAGNAKAPNAICSAENFLRGKWRNYSGICNRVIFDHLKFSYENLMIK